jgi:hypothetical protein
MGIIGQIGGRPLELKEDGAMALGGEPVSPGDCMHKIVQAAVDGGLNVSQLIDRDAVTDIHRRLMDGKKKELIRVRAEHAERVAEKLGPKERRAYLQAEKVALDAVNGIEPDVAGRTETSPEDRERRVRALEKYFGGDQNA